MLISQSKNIEVTLKNTGLQTLVVDTANITLGGAEASAFSIISNPGANISAGEQSQFIIQCAPTKQGENNAILTIPTNDSSRNPAVAYLKVTGIQGSALLELTTQENTTIANNAITPFDFGQVEVGTYKNFVFTIKNKGNIPLELTGAAAVESSGAVFTVPAQPGSRIIAPGSTVPFVMRYTPAEEREDTATITILNNSSDLQFTFTVKGTGFIQKPQISVKQGAAVLDAHEVFDFGTIAAGKTKDFTFTIENTGEANLTFVTENNNRINLADNAAGLFSVVYQPSASTTVTPGGSASFTLRFSPAAQGNNFTATVQIKTNSRDNDEFIFTVKGSARAAKTEARLSALQFTHGKLDQQFNANIFAYTLKVDAGLSLVNVTPTSIDADISDLVVNGWSQSSGSRSEDIILDSTGAVTVIVTAEDGTASQTYTVTINRIVNYSSAALASLYVSNMAGSDEGNVLDSLNAYNTAYWDALPDETQLKFKITPLNSNATVKVNDSTITNGVYTGGYTLDPGAAVSTFTLTVISEDGDNQRTISLKSSYLGSQWERVGAFPAGGLDDWWEALPSVVVHNNQFVLTNKDEVFLSTNGTSWTKTYTYPEEIMHPWCSTVLFNNTIYNIGGYKLNVAGDTYEAAPLVSYSTNGTIWTNPAVTGLTNGVSHQASVVFNNAIYTMGGTTKTLIQTNAVWRSTNGTAWTQLNAPGWGARAGHASVVFNNKIFVMGGFYNDGASEYRDVWSSGNGTTWTRETASAAWTGRNDHTVNVNGKGMWLAGGNDGFYKNDVWFSRNGKDWVQVLQNAPFGVRAYHAAVVKDGYLYIFGGITGDLEDNISNLYDIWRTYIGE